MYEDKLLPAQKSQILKLNTAIKRIKSKTYSSDYSKEKDKAIKAAEADRLAGLVGPTYLAGVKFPWTSDRGHAPIHYDAYQVDSFSHKLNESKVVMLPCVSLNTQQTKVGLGGQARS